MEKGKIVTKTDQELEEFMKMNKDILYKKTSMDVGSRVSEGNKDKRKAIDGKFTKVKLYNYLFIIVTLF
jgi:hypothetical protein